jgi:hypothetical protein
MTELSGMQEMYGKVGGNKQNKQNKKNGGGSSCGISQMNSAKLGGNNNNQTVKYNGGNYKVQIGPRGGKFITHLGRKVYLNE